MRVLGIETSCDETSAAVYEDGKLLSNVISSQAAHGAYGGVVPELASREHLRLIIPVVSAAFAKAGTSVAEIDAVAVTAGPGLMGSLLVGVNFARSLAESRGIPCIGVNHLEGHLYSTFLADPEPSFPFLCLIVSGGHTQLVLVRDWFRHTLLGETLDDAAGEAFDKVARMLGLGFPGGPAIDKCAVGGNPAFVDFPRSMVSWPSGLQFSFSGVKTAVLYWLRDHRVGPEQIAANPKLRADLCASFQQAVVDVLVAKTLRARRETEVKDVAVAGGVSANSALRGALRSAAAAEGFRLHIPAPVYCTDNAAMIALTGYRKLTAGSPSHVPSVFQADPNLALTA